MKKLIALALTVVLGASMVACSSSSDSQTNTGDSQSGDKLRVQLIVTRTGDKSFNDSANLGLQRAEKELGIEYKLVEYGDDNSKAEPTITEAAEDGYDVVIFNNLGYGIAVKWLQDNAASYPDTTFLVYDESQAEVNASNVQFLCYKANESDFLAGALAAKLSETGTISFVGGENNPVIADFLVGYIQGAKYVNPDIKMTIAYTESWTDATKGKELGLAAINAGADIVHAVAGSAGNGALTAAQEQGVYGIGVDSDQYELFKNDKPELAASIVTSSLKNVGESIYVTLQSIMDGTFVGGSQTWFGMPEGCAGIAENENYHAVVSEEIIAEIEEIKEKMANGEIVVESYFGMDTARYNELVASVA